MDSYEDGRAEIALIRQEHDYGCGLASLAMATGKSYDEVRSFFLAEWPGGTQKPEDWLESRGIHHGLVEWFLARHGFVWRVVYSGWEEHPWPPAPFAPVHIAQVIQPSRNTHYVVMLNDGRVLDPLSGTLGLALDNWERVNNVMGIWPEPLSERVPSAAEIEAAAVVLGNYDAAPDGETWDDLDEEQRNWYRPVAKRVLLAARSVTQPEEG